MTFERQIRFFFSCLFSVQKFCVVINSAIESQFFPPDENNITHLPLIYFVPSDQWQLEIPVEIEMDRLKAKLEDQFRPVIRLKINLQRRPLFYKLVLVYPSVILYLLSPVTYFIPPDSGEKVSFAVTILLTEVVSYATLVDILPASSLNVPYLVYFLTAATLHLTWNCVTAVIGKLKMFLLG